MWGDIPSWAYDAAKLLMQSLKSVDPATYYHCVRVGELSRKLARDAGLNEYQQKLAEFSGLFHDVGKIAINKEIIHKPAKLDEHEYGLMKKHPEISEEIVRTLAHHTFFASMLNNIRGHHERIDGTGYPDKLLADNIPLLSRVILIVDTYDAMSQTRAYRKGMPVEMVYEELKRFSGTQFDAQLVQVFLKAHPHWSKEEGDPETHEKIVKAAS